jgi:hypothetical protein
MLQGRKKRGGQLGSLIKAWIQSLKPTWLRKVMVGSDGQGVDIGEARQKPTYYMWEHVPRRTVIDAAQVPCKAKYANNMYVTLHLD